ncbi:hypothetical protein AVEN_208340-1 [Araneus ventricosus]|uniref:Uncharacterized protein n=1 Tax=Araneus ventricosus TaxID=182803 RepID=A0A4Y2FD75_ARAVE|nr:hypothetical protein AVEN_208340-1 [Araneus ventricosus]
MLRRRETPSNRGAWQGRFRIQSRILETRKMSQIVYHNEIVMSLVILTSRFGVTRGLFWDGPRHLEPRSDDEDDVRADIPSPIFRKTPARGRLAPHYYK